MYIICMTLYFHQLSSGGVSLAVGAERKRGAEQQDALQLAAQLGARSQGGGGGGASSRSGAGSGEGATDKDKKLKNLRKVSKGGGGRWRECLWYTCDISILILCP